MTPTEIRRKTAEIRGDVRRLDQTLAALQTENPDLEMVYLEKFTLLAAGQAEKLALRMRHLIYRSELVPRKEYLVMAAEALDIRLTVEPDLLRVTLPILVPYRKERAGREFVSGPLYRVLSAADQQNRLPRFENCIVCVVHHLDESKCGSLTPDYDNFELKGIQDIFAAFCMVDDNMKYCARYETMQPDTTCFTEFWIMPQTAFPAWLEGQKGIRKNDDFSA